MNLNKTLSRILQDVDRLPILSTISLFASVAILVYCSPYIRVQFGCFLEPGHFVVLFLGVLSVTVSQSQVGRLTGCVIIVLFITVVESLSPKVHRDGYGVSVVVMTFSLILMFCASLVQRIKPRLLMIACGLILLAVFLMVHWRLKPIQGL